MVYFKMKKPNREWIKYNFWNSVYFFETGRNRTVGRIYGTISEFIILFTFLQVKGFELSIAEYIYIPLGYFFLCYLLGRLYVVKDTYKYERTIDNAQNEEIMIIKEKVEEIHKWIKNH